MRSLTSTVWTLVRPLVRPCFLAAASNGNPWRMPWWLWRRIRPSLWESMSRNLLQEAEERAAEVLTNAHPLAHVITKDELANGWVATPTTLLTIWQQLATLRPCSVLELGSGVSTLLFALYAQGREKESGTPPIVISIDHDEGWLKKTGDRLTTAGVDRYVRLVHAPLTKYKVGLLDTQTYEPGRIVEELSSHHFDFCFIDGPPGMVGRVGTLPVIAKYLADSSAIFLDDSRRLGEQSAIQLWRSLYPIERRCETYLTDRGLAKMVWARSPV
jgi:predicted O-methyltransferase YrrM